MRKTFLFLSMLLASVAYAAGPWSLASFDQSLVATVSQTATQGLTLSVARNDTLLLSNCPLGVIMDGATGNFTGGLVFVSASDSVVDERYVLMHGKRRDCWNHARQKSLTFNNAGDQAMVLDIRAFDDGIAFRYRFPGSGGTRRINAEATTFAVPNASAATGWFQKYRENDYQGRYPAVRPDTCTWDIGFPLLFKMPGSHWMLLTEAAVYGASYSAGHVKAAGGSFRIALGGGGYVQSTLPWTTPWRVIMAGTLKTIFESTLVQDLNPPNEIADTSWIRPGKIAWSWLTSGVSLDGQKAFIAFASQMGWDYVLVDEGWQDSWVPDLVSYGAARNVGIILWYGWLSGSGEQANQARLTQCQSWGVKGVKVDFTGSDNEDAMKFYDYFTQDAIGRKQMVLWHGTTLPRGQERRWPNIMSWEAVAGEEEGWTGRSPTHKCTLPFTRNVVGPMDPTHIVFSRKGDSLSAAFELSLSVIDESGWFCYGDNPGGFKAYPPAMEFLKRVPVRWDETRLVEGYPGQYLCVARRSGGDWYLGAINARQARHIAVPLTFLTAGRGYQASAFSGSGWDSIQTRQRTWTADSVIDIPLSLGAGFCARITPASPAGTLTACERFIPAIPGPMRLYTLKGQAIGKNRDAWRRCSAAAYVMQAENEHGFSRPARVIMGTR